MTADATVLREVLLGHVRDRPDKVFLKFADGSEWTYSQTLHEARVAAARLAHLGVGRGDRVLTWLPNGPDLIRIWFGTNLLGAIHAPCNLAWRKEMLRNAFDIAKPKVTVIHDTLESVLNEAVPHHSVTVRLSGCTASERHWSNTPMAAFEEADDLHSADGMQILFTSGTTGLSKGALTSYRHCAEFLSPPDPAAFDEDSTFLLVLPLFHAGGVSSLYKAFLGGASVAIPDSFKTERFWDDVNRFGATSTTLVGAMATFLLAATEKNEVAAHTLKHTNISPLTPVSYRFSEVFGTSLWASYGATEIGAIITASAYPDRPGLTGWLREGYEARLVDSHDETVPEGSAGELVVRSHTPWVLLTEYVERDDATAQSWRNGWFHTGDIFKQDADGGYIYLDRKKDMIRRRGENISSMEVELALSRLGLFREVAVFAATLADGEEEVAAAIVPTGAFDDTGWPSLIEALGDQIAHFMIPRFFRIMESLPRNETGKIKKDELRGQGLTSDIWDREAAGIMVRARRVG